MLVLKARDIHDVNIIYWGMWWWYLKIIHLAVVAKLKILVGNVAGTLGKCRITWKCLKDFWTPGYIWTNSIF